jgi:hypothetical protein
LLVTVVCMIYLAPNGLGLEQKIILIDHLLPVYKAAVIAYCGLKNSIYLSTYY